MNWNGCGPYAEEKMAEFPSVEMEWAEFSSSAPSAKMPHSKGRRVGGCESREWGMGNGAWPSTYFRGDVIMSAGASDVGVRGLGRADGQYAMRWDGIASTTIFGITMEMP